MDTDFFLVECCLKWQIKWNKTINQFLRSVIIKKYAWDKINKNSLIKIYYRKEDPNGQIKKNWYQLDTL